MSEYADKLKEEAYRPREYLERQLNMTDEEKANRAIFFEEFFRHHEGAESRIA